MAVFYELIELCLLFLVGDILIDGFESYPILLEVAVVEELHQIVVVVIVYHHERVPKAVEVDFLGLDAALADLCEEIRVRTTNEGFEMNMLMGLTHAKHAE